MMIVIAYLFIVFIVVCACCWCWLLKSLLNSTSSGFYNKAQVVVIVPLEILTLQMMANDGVNGVIKMVIDVLH